jgi:hypothetical protein
VAAASCRAASVDDLIESNHWKQAYLIAQSRLSSNPFDARVIYYCAVRRNVILLLYIYPKNVTTDLTPRQIKQLAKVVKEEFVNEKGDV